MNRHPHANDSAGAGRPRPFHQRLAALMLAAVWLLAGLPAPVRAAPARGPVENYELLIRARQESDYPGPICAGDKVTFTVWADKTGFDAAKQKYTDPDQVPGHKVWASSGNSAILVLESSSPRVTSIEVDEPFTTSFTFKGKKPGTTEVIFKAKMPTNYLSEKTQKNLSASGLNRILNRELRVPLTVLDCSLQVMIIDRFEVNVPGEGTADMVGVMDWTRLKQTDTDGKQFSATGTKYVVFRQFGGECKFYISVGKRSVDIKAEKTDVGYVVEFSNGEVKIDYKTVCQEGVGMKNFSFADFGGLSCSIDPNGGTCSRPLNGPGYTMSSTVSVRQELPEK